MGAVKKVNANNVFLPASSTGMRAPFGFQEAYLDCPGWLLLG